MATPTKTAIITGGCSGIGLSLAQHLLSLPFPTWRVVIADINESAYRKISSTLDPDRHIFIPTDVASWDAQAALFKRAYDYSGEKIDFLAANAGTTEKDHIVLDGNSAWDLDAEPTRPPLIATQVNQIAVFYGLKLFVHYARRTARTAVPFHPKVVITSSCTAIYPFPVAPEYCATKHAVMALARSVGPLLLQMDKIAVNCIMPAYVDTNITPAEVTARWQKKYLTPLSTLNRAFDELIDETGKVEQDGKSDGVDGQVKTGQAVECALDRLYYRQPVDYPDQSQKWASEQALHMNGAWWQGMRARAAKGLS